MSSMELCVEKCCAIPYEESIKIILREVKCTQVEAERALNANDGDIINALIMLFN